ncbi:hypothetical protein [Magnetospirillum sp. SS-4]|uniref:hypothetical protein n=1 Tax=Magnetospirillum sp. SS-4 TaxID=2681465 RepID=UPI001383A389|nr:hypothetical protein [Magnetospirillum sp. SS-4]CAA7615975.1 conserved hypothetical protein [Magnetospirillum sp. SS-4]
MPGRLYGHAGRVPLDEDTLDEMEGEALVIVEHADRYSHQTVEMARKMLDMIRRLRRKGDSEPEACPSLFRIVAGGLDPAADQDDALLAATA